MTFIEKLILTESLLNLPSMRDTNSRDSILEGLGNRFTSGVRRHNIAKIEVLNIVSRCGSVNGSFDELISSLKFIDEETDELKFLETTIQKLILMRDLIGLFQKEINDSYKNHICYWYQCSLNLNTPQQNGQVINLAIDYLIDKIVRESEVTECYPLLIFAEGLAFHINNKELKERVREKVEALANIFQINENVISQERQRISEILESNQQPIEHPSEVTEKLKSNQVKKINGILSEFSILKDQKISKSIFQEINQNYNLNISSSTNIEENLSSFTKVCRNRPIFLLYLFDILKAFGNDEDALNNFRSFLEEVEILQSNLVQTSSAKIQTTIDNSIRIQINNRDRVTEEFEIFLPDKNEACYIPRKFRNLTTEEINQFQKISSGWKKIHTLCERLNRDYNNVYFYIKNGNIDIGRKCLIDLEQRFDDFGSDLRQFEGEQQILSIPQIQALKTIPECFFLIVEALNSENIEYCKNGQLLAIRIRDLLLECLRLADSIIECQLKNTLSQGR